MTMVRGNIVYENDKIVAEPGIGKPVSRVKAETENAAPLSI
ncbi:hypothetical protein [Mesobacillus jeotgali]|nr:hypothetical protein [Mesobacillus jeotgali]